MVSNLGWSLVFAISLLVLQYPESGTPRLGRLSWLPLFTREYRGSRKGSVGNAAYAIPLPSGLQTRNSESAALEGACNSDAAVDPPFFIGSIF